MTEGTERSPGLSVEARRRLHDWARACVRAAVRGEPGPVFAWRSPGTEACCGAFVTLSIRGSLRGCIGVTGSEDPLWKTVGEMAVAAALRDPRFPEVTPRELDDLDLEISVLGPLRPITSVEEIRLGIDGVLLRKGRASGLFLPQVASERGWDRVRFLENLAAKAGLATDEWKGADLLVFEAEVF